MSSPAHELSLLMASARSGGQHITIAYHEDCPDGILSAAIVESYLEAESSLCPFDSYPVNYSKPFPAEVESPRGSLIFVDFCPDQTHRQLPAIIDNLEANGGFLVIIDHHESREKDMASIYLAIMEHGRCVPCFTAYDKDRSGAGLVYHLLFRRHPPDIVKFVQDRDLWKFRHDETHLYPDHTPIPNIAAAKIMLKVRDYFFGALAGTCNLFLPMEEELACKSDWDKARKLYVDYLRALATLDSGESLMPYLEARYPAKVRNLESQTYIVMVTLIMKMRRTEKRLSRCGVGEVRLKNGDSHYVMVNNGGDSSELGNWCAQRLRLPFIGWHLNSLGQAIVSFRSDENCSVSALELAQEIGGGGHRHAAGGNMPFRQWVEVLDNLKLQVDSDSHPSVVTRGFLSWTDIVHLHSAGATTGRLSAYDGSAQSAMTQSGGE